MQIITTFFIYILCNVRLQKGLEIYVLKWSLNIKCHEADMLFFVTWFLKDNGSMGSSAAKEMDESRMKRRMILVKVVALMMRWQSFRNLME